MALRVLGEELYQERRNFDEIIIELVFMSKVLAYNSHSESVAHTSVREGFRTTQSLKI